MKLPNPSLDLLGWREWLSIPALGIPWIQAKVDTGARSSCLHTDSLEPYETPDGELRVRFTICPLRDDLTDQVACDLAVINSRIVRDSGGHEEMRPFVKIPIQLGPHHWTAEFSLTNRDKMKFRVLLGRTAMKNRFAVNPALSYQFGQPPRLSDSPKD